MAVGLPIVVETLELVIIDPKQTDFTVFGSLPHLRKGSVITDAQAGIDEIQEIADHEMQSRSERLQKAGYRDIKAFNKEHPKDPIRPLVILIDEYADLVAVLTKKRARALRDSSKSFDSAGSQRRHPSRARNTATNC